MEEIEKEEGRRERKGREKGGEREKEGVGEGGRWGERFRLVVEGGGVGVFLEEERRWEEVC